MKDEEEHALSAATVERILQRIAGLTLGVIGDLFLDRYLDIDSSLTEPSLETGLNAYQVVGVRAQPGAAGTVLNNLAALGVRRLCPISVIGDDGEGYELRQALARMPAVDPAGVFSRTGRRTPTYTKPMLHEPAHSSELNRLDIKNRLPLPADAEEQVAAHLEQLWPQLDGLAVLDQVSEADCGTITAAVRGRIARLGERDPDKPILADSRERIGLFRAVMLKPNDWECLTARRDAGPTGRDAGPTQASTDLPSAVRALADRAGRTVFCTLGERGMLVQVPGTEPRTVPGYPVAGPTDPVGAGDSASAGILCALAAGASAVEAAAFGNLVASITVGQVGTTGTATPAQVRGRG
jgi:bifunctional ADP-heptose synthase (sugar kinase/adenylyltransferase)